MTRVPHTLVALVAAFALSGVPLADAQTPHRAKAELVKPAKEPPKPPPPPAPLDPGAPPYETQLLRLSELLGSLTYLRDLCGFGDGADYRAKMAALLDAEAAPGPRRERIAGSFNRGYRSYETLHRTCTPASRLVVQRAMGESAALAREISNRFGNS
jgi:uncharacterized protein (TIGR02301 family)